MEKGGLIFNGSLSIVGVRKNRKIASAGSDQESTDNFYEKKCGEYGYVIF